MAAEVEKKEGTTEKKQKWTEIAEVKMMFYVIPVALVLLVVALLLGK